MYTYFMMGLPFVTAVLLLDLIILKTKTMFSRQCWIAMLIMVALTAIFDQLLTGLPIINYNETKLLGIYLGHAPVEDFMYTLAAVIGLGSLGKYYEQRQS